MNQGGFWFTIVKKQIQTQDESRFFMTPNTSTTPSLETMDFSLCEQEILDRTDAIQAGGAVLLLDETTHEVVGVSSNWFYFTQGLQHTWPETPVLLSQVLARPEELDELQDETLCVTPTASAARHQRSFELQATRANGYIFIEWVYISPTLKNLQRKTVQTPLPEADTEKNLYQSLQNVTAHLKEMLDIDRVMVYQFTEDASGDVVAESCREDWAPYLGLHYPASDIPRIARELYLKTPLRQIYDSMTPAVSLLTTPDIPVKTLDLTPCSLRSVSPYHLEYLQNMGVRATFSVAIVHEGKLWGLIACHNAQPLLLSLEAKQYALTVKQQVETILAQWYTRQETLEQQRADAIFQEQQAELERLENHQQVDILESLLLGAHGLQSLANADAAAIYADGVIASTGNCPSEDWLKAFVDQWATSEDNELFISHHLNEDSPIPSGFSGEISGMMALKVLHDPAVVLLVFRQEFLHEIHWGGEPYRQGVRSDGRFSPRRSFQLWKETVVNKARPWSELEIKCLQGLKTLLMSRFSAAALLEVLQGGVHELARQITQHTYIARALTNTPQGGIAMTLLASPGEAPRLLNINHGLNNNFELPLDLQEGSATMEDVLRQMGLTSEQIESLNSIPKRMELWSPRLGHRTVKMSRHNLIALHAQQKRYSIASVQFFDITAEERVESSLRSAHRQVNQSDAAKLKFLTHTSQELMVPLQQIMHLSERLDGELAEVALDDLNLYTDQITHFSKHMYNRVEQLLFYARSASGHVLMALEPVCVNKLLKECIMWLRSLAQSHEVSLRYEQEYDIEVMGNRDALRHMFINILDNAIRYSPQGSLVQCRLNYNQSNEYVFLEVEDQGKGIHEKDLANVFLPFFTGEHADQLNVLEGSGIGLTLVKHIAEAHGGRVELDSNVNMGTQVQVMIPVEQLEDDVTMRATGR